MTSLFKVPHSRSIICFLTPRNHPLVFAAPGKGTCASPYNVTLAPTPQVLVPDVDLCAASDDNSGQLYSLVGNDYTFFLHHNSQTPITVIVETLPTVNGSQFDVSPLFAASWLGSPPQMWVLPAQGLRQQIVGCLHWLLSSLNSLRTLEEVL